MTMTKLLKACRLFAIAAALLCAFLFTGATPAHADATPVLGAAGNFGVLGLSGSETVTNSLVTINGNEGAVQGATIANNAPSTVTGNVYVNTTSQYSGPGTVDGSVIANTSMMGSSGTVQTAVTALINQISGYTGFGSSLGNITTGTTLSASGTLTEVLLGSINLNNANLTLNGTSSDYFVIEVTGNLSLTGTASLLLTGGITASHVIYDFTSLSCLFSTNVGDTVDGIMLGPHCAMNVDGTFNGELISGNNITLMSGAVVNQPAVPEPGTLSLFATGLLGLLGFARRRLNS